MKKVRKRWLALIVSAVMVLSMFPATVFAQTNEADAAHSHCTCGNKIEVGDHTSHTELAYQPLTGDINWGDIPSGNYYLTEDTTITYKGYPTIKAGSIVHLCLNGHTLYSSENALYVLNVYGTLNLCDCQESGKVQPNPKRGNSKGILVSGATATMNFFGGEISGFSDDSYGAGINVDGGTLKMYGGTVANNAGMYGGGIAVQGDSGNAVIYGGIISGNTASMQGGGIDNRGTLVIYDAEVSNNTTAGEGGGIANAKTFEMHGGKISGNTAEEGGGVHNQWGSFVMSDGVISGNIANSGGGIKNREDLTISGGSIIDNASTTSRGGGVDHLNGKSLTLGNNGPITITGNIAGKGSSKEITSNLYIGKPSTEDQKIKLAEGMDSDSSIGLLVGGQINTTPVTLTAPGFEPYIDCFSYDSDAYVLRIINNGELAIVSRVTITFEAGKFGIEQDYTDSISLVKGDEITMPGVLYTRAGYTQTGWTANPEGIKKNYDLNEKVVWTYASNTFYPYWSLNELELSGEQPAELVEGYRESPALKVTVENENKDISAGNPDFHYTLYQYQWYTGSENEKVKIDGAESADYDVPLGLDAGEHEYTVKITAVNQCTGEQKSAEYMFKVVVKPYIAVPGTDYDVNSNDWLNTDFVVTAKDGYSLSLNGNGEWSKQLTVSEENTNGVLNFYVRNNTTGAVSEMVSETYKIDKTMPEVKGIADGGTYCLSAGFTVTEDNLDTVKVDGETVEATDGIYTLKPGEHEVVVMDKAGNQMTIKVVVNESHKGGTNTCTSGALCEVCGEVYGQATGHVETELKNAKEAACTEEGYTGDKVCKVCGEILEKGTVIEKTAHTFGKWVVTKEPTATKKGEKQHTCTICGYAEKQKIPATGTPSDPSDPTKPGQPDDTDKPSDTAKSDKTNPQTGDDSNIALWSAVMLIAAASLIGTVIYSRKRKYNK